MKQARACKSNVGYNKSFSRVPGLIFINVKSQNYVNLFDDLVQLNADSFVSLYQVGNLLAQILEKLIMEKRKERDCTDNEKTLINYYDQQLFR